VSKLILPDDLREKIINSFQEGLSSLEIFDSVYDEAISYVDSDAKLSRCIASLKGKYTLREAAKEEKTQLIPDDIDKDEEEIEVLTPPKPKTFDASAYEEIISGLTEHMSGYEFEKACHGIVMDILENYEGFKNIVDANEGEGFHNPPFDFIGFKDKLPYIIEFKGSLKNFNIPGETQKRRIKELLEKIDGLKIALLQVKLRKAQYRMLFTEHMELLFDGKQTPIEPIENWIRGIIDIYK